MRHTDKEYVHVPKSKLVCPFCKDELNIKFEGFTCYSAVGGPYLKGRIALECSGEKCNYRHAILFKADDGRTLTRMEAALAVLVKRLPGLGPWSHFETNEKEKRRYNHRRI